MRVVFSERSFAALLAETTEKITTETGGLFLGVVRDDTWYIVEAIDPGPKSIFEVAYFEYDQVYTEHLINKIANLYNCKLDLIGLWHRHPGSLDQFSSTDDGTNYKYASMRREGAISGLVNIDPFFRLTMYHVSSPCYYRKIGYEVGDSLIPQELLELKTPEKYFHLMERRMSPQSRDKNTSYKKTVSLDSFMRFIEPYIKDAVCEDDETNIAVIDASAADTLTEAIIEDLTYMTDTVGIEVVISMQEQYLVVSQESVDKTTRLYFMNSATKKQVVFSFDGNCYLYKPNMFRAAAQKAKADKDRQSDSSRTGRRLKHQGKGWDPFVQVIKFIRNEETDDGNKNT